MNRQWLSILPEKLTDYGIYNVIISPGSRNAPLLLHLTSNARIKLFEQVDERAAGFLALGMAQFLNKPVVLICTSGSAVLNYGPAIAEAYYQHIPLLVLTADRPPEWIDQADGQTMKQQSIFQNFILKSYQLPVEINHPDDKWYVHRIFSEAIQYTMDPVKGPVHVNIPLREPLYQIEEVSKYSDRGFKVMPSKRVLEKESLSVLGERWSKAFKILIIAGLNYPSHLLKTELIKLSNKPEVVILTDITSNLYHSQFLKASDDLIELVQENIDMVPDLLISIGGPIISKKLKTWLRLHKPMDHWHINDSFEFPDTFQSLTKVIPCNAIDIIQYFNELFTKSHSNYSNYWHSLSTKLMQFQYQFFKNCLISDFKACYLISTVIPENSVIHFSNSMPVRYAQFFDWHENNLIFSNRGVSGIDGCISTATGSAFVSQKITTIITGDLAMLYDSHALWNNPLPNNLRIIVLNNGGGGIFKIINGPDKIPQYQKVFTTPHTLRMNKLAEMHHIKYFLAKNDEEIITSLNNMFFKESEAVILEIITDNLPNEQIYNNYFSQLKNITNDENMDKN